MASVGGKFGTFGGVFTPSILTILGVIMYLRLPEIVGKAGLFSTLLIILVAHFISVTTGLSVSSIATDKRVQAGGTYYMISRSLGLPIGGTLGIALFVGLSFSVSLYLIGFAESFLRYWDFEITQNTIRLAGTAVLLLVTAITFISTSLAIKTQYFIMAAIGLSLLSIFFGRHPHAPVEAVSIGPESAVPMMVLFGIFFPAVTGFEAGVSMSGDLRDPKKSIPAGAIAAIAVGFVVYLGLAIFFFYTVDREVLQDPNVLLKISLVPQLVVAGIWGATLSSALGSILGAPRILQATAVDNITPKFFSRTSGRVQEPRNALILTFFIAEGGILIGDLDVIARIVTIFFIMTYGFLNLSAAFETLTSADFRPEFKTPAWVSGIGAAACILVMIQLDLLAMFAAALILGLLFFFLKRKELKLESGDAWSGVWASMIKAGVAQLGFQKTPERNWRPNIIMFGGSKLQRRQLEEFGNAMCGRLGMISSFDLITDPDTDPSRRQKILQQENGDEANAFTFQYRCRNAYEGMKEVSRLYGFHGIEPNTILMGWSREKGNRSDFARLLEFYDKSDFNTVLLSHNPDRKFGSGKTIDLWWSAAGSNLSFALVLLRHLTAAHFWSAAAMRLLVINYDSTKKEQIHRALIRLLDDYRVDMSVKVINNQENRLDEREIIQRESAETDLTIVGLGDEAMRTLDSTISGLNDLLSRLGTAAIIRGASAFEEVDVGVVTVTRKLHDEGEEPDIPVSLPELPSPADPDLAEDVRKTDISGSRALTLFYEKAFAPCFTAGLEQLDAFRSIALAACASAEKAFAFTDSYRHGKSILKAKNDYLYSCRRLFEQMRENLITVQSEAVTEGLQKYSSWLEKSYMRFPRRRPVNLSDIDHVREPEALEGDKPFTRFRQWISRFFGKTLQRAVQRAIPARKIARHYLYDSRHAFLADYLNELQESHIAHLTRLKSLAFSLLDSISTIKREVSGSKLNIASIQQEILDRVDQSKEDLSQRGHDYGHRLQLEFRQTLVSMVGYLQPAIPLMLHGLRGKGKKYYSKLAAQNRSFPERYLAVLERTTNKAHLDILIASTQCRVEDRMEDFSLNAMQQVDSGISRPLGKTMDEIESMLNEAAEETEFELACRMDTEIDIEEGLEELREQVFELTRSLPETLLVGDDTEEASIPVMRLTRHLLESRLIGPLQTFLSAGSESMRRLAFGVKDFVNLTRFNLQNIDAETPDRKGAARDILNNALDSVRREAKSVDDFKKSFREEMGVLLANAFESLGPARIEKSAGELTETLRGYTGHRVLSTFGRWRNVLARNLERRITRILYSRSEGLIISNKRKAEKAQVTGSSPILDLVQAVSPDGKVLKSLPQFYINLFNSRSSIGTEFYVERKADQLRMERAVARYGEGYRGGILVLGERNAGKTVFCKHTVKRIYPDGNVHHIFPPKAGSDRVEDLARVVEQVTDVGGNMQGIAATLPHGTVLVFHDLELWFERRRDGLAALGVLAQLLDDFSDKILFVLNTNPHSFALMNNLVPMEKKFLSIVQLSPFSTEELKDLVLRRHKSSGLHFRWNRKTEGRLSEFRMAELFDSYFNYSEGNPGVGLNAWLSNINRASGSILDIGVPDIPNLSALQNLDEDWLVVLAHCALHKRLTADRLERITDIKEAEFDTMLHQMRNSGLVDDLGRGVFAINRFLEPFLIRVLGEKQLL